MSQPSTASTASVVLDRLRVVEHELVALASKAASFPPEPCNLNLTERRARIAANLAAVGQLHAVTSAVAVLQRLVLAADQLGPAGSVSELVARAIRLVLLDELIVLRDILSSAAAIDRARARFFTPLGSFAKVDGFVRVELHRVTLLFTALRGGPRDAYRAALRAAHASLRRLGQHDKSAVGAFLQDGQARRDWPELQRACARIVEALAIRIDVDPDLPLLVMKTAPASTNPEAKP